MALPKYQIRRAILDDIGALTAMWESMQYPAADLARRITEFQVAVDPEGKVLGCVALQIAQRQGLIHSEAFTDYGLSDQLRPLLWERLQGVAANHGLWRLWTRERAPFWNQCGLFKADEEALAKLPAIWKSDSAPWLTLKLKEDVEEILSADKEFALFKESEKQRSERAMQQARVLKMIATVLAFALLGLVLFGAFLVIKKQPQLIHRNG